MSVSARRGGRLVGWAASAALLVIAVWVLRGRWEAVGDAGGLPALGPADRR
jgi:hypothetical protein